MRFSNCASISVGLLFPWLSAVQALDFSYSPTSLGSCGNVTVSWSSGSPPFYLLAVPVFGSPRNFSIPGSAYSNGKGSYTTQLKFPQSQQYVLILSDSTGYGSLGISPVLEISNSSSASCNTTDPGVAFTFELDDNLQQCRSFSFQNFQNASQPVTIFGAIPAGQPFTLSPPKGPTDYTWSAVDIYNSTTVIFMMTDSEQRQGGSSALLSVGITDDSSCISPSSPSVTASSQFATASSTSSSGSSSSKTGAIIGSVLGGVLVFAVVISLTLFYLRRRKERKDPWIEASGAFSHRSDNLNLLADVRAPSNPFSSTTFNDRSSRVSSSISRPQSELPSSAHFLPSGTEVTPFTATSDGSRSAHRSGKGSSDASSRLAPRYILHHDAEDVVPEEEPEEVVELPPQYSERRALHSSSQSGLSSPGPSNPNFGDRKAPYPL